MILRTIILLVSLAAADALRSDEDVYDLDESLWRDRVLVAVAAAPGQEDLVQMRDAAVASACEFSNRDLVLVSIVGDGGRVGGRELDAGSVRRLRARLPLADHPFEMLLIGKDGGIKAAWRQAVPLTEIFALIDGMPMRRDESRNDRPCR